MAEVVRYVNTASSGGDGTTNGESGGTAAYASLSAWEAAEQVDLVAAGNTHVVNCDVGTGSAADTTAVTVAGWTTGASNYITIQANPSGVGGDQSAQSPYSTAIYRLEVVVTGAALQVDASYTQILRMQIKVPDTTTTGGIHRALGIGLGASATNCLVNRCHLWYEYNNASNAAANTTGSGYTLQFTATNAANSVVRNSIVRCSNAAAGKPYEAIAILFGGTGDSVQALNCTSYVETAQSLAAAYWSGATTTAVLKNCLGEAGAATTSNDFRSGVSWGAGTDYNASNDATAPGANSLTSKTFTFVSATDFHLSVTDTSGAITGGDNLSATFTDDFDAETRTVPWSIGADELDLAGFLRHLVGGGLTQSALVR